VLYDFDFKTGKKRWERELLAGEPLAAKHPKNSYASETPVTDGRYVYVYSGDLGLYAIDFKGNIVWKKRVLPPNSLPGENPALLKGRIDFGTGASAVLHKDRLYVTQAHEPMQQGWFLAAYSAKNGEELWRVTGDRAPRGRPTWNTPFVWENAQRTEIVTLADGTIRSFDLNGKPLWHLGPIGASVQTPIAANGLLYVGSGYPGDATRPVWAVRPGASGDITLAEGKTSSDFVAWFNPKITAYIPSPIVYGKYFYVLESLGFMQCVDAATGERIYGRKRIDVTSGFTASPWAYNGKIFALSEDGDTYVIQPGPDFKVLRKNSLGEMALATPAVVNKSVILRTVSSLYRIAER
jgi:outer membrane protein assembly factor BamB